MLDILASMLATYMVGGIIAGVVAFQCPKRKHLTLRPRLLWAAFNFVVWPATLAGMVYDWITGT